MYVIISIVIETCACYSETINKQGGSYAAATAATREREIHTDRDRGE